MAPELFANLHTFLLCNSHIRTQDELASVALLVYAVYNATNHFRRNPVAEESDVLDAVAQRMREGAKNHQKASRALDNRWTPGRRDTLLPPIPLHI